MQENKQPDATAKFEVAFNDLAKTLIDAQNTVNHLMWQKDEVKREFAAIQAAAESLEIYTEREAAALLKLKPAQLATLRRAENLPFVRAGALIRYSKENLAEIVKILTVNSDKKPKK